MMNRSCVVALCAAIAFVAAPAYAGISISLKPARTSGVSPLYVFFDATGTTSTDVSDPFGDLLYQWNFGDANPVSGGGAVWNVSGKPKNKAIGPVAAHVYECAGPSNCTETVTLTVQAPDGVVNTATTTITVYPAGEIDGGTPGRNSVCVSTGSDFAGCPNGASHVTSSAPFQSILSSEIDGNGKRRILFRRGDSWNATGSFSLAANGPGIIGAFGSGNDPFIRETSDLGTDGIIDCYGYDASGAGSGADWRVMDLKAQGASSDMSSYTSGGVFISTTYGRTCKQLLIYRDDASLGGFVMAYSISVNHVPPGGQLHDQVAIVSSSAANSHTVNSWYGSQRGAFLGGTFGRVGEEHVIRIPCAEGLVFSDNSLSGAPKDKHELKIHAQEGLCPNNISRKIVISDNHFTSSASQWSVVVQGNLNACCTSDERVEDVIFERNLLTVDPSGAGSSQFAVVVDTIHGFWRNNLLIGTGGSPYWSGFGVFDTARYNPDNNVIVNNTCYTNDSGTHYCVDAGSGTNDNTTIRDNLLYEPNSSASAGTALAARCGGTNCTADHNLSEIGTAIGSPFVSNQPQAPSDFALHAVPNPAIGAGVSVPTFVDFGLRIRGTGRDLGAWVFDPNAATAPAAPVLLP